MLLESDAQENITYREVLLFEHFAHKAYFSSKIQLCVGGASTAPQPKTLS